MRENKSQPVYEAPMEPMARHARVIRDEDPERRYRKRMSPRPPVLSTAMLPRLSRVREENED